MLWATISQYDPQLPTMTQNIYTISQARFSIVKLFLILFYIRSSLFYNISALHEQHKCDTSDMSLTRALHERSERDTIATQMTRVQKRVKNFDFDNDMSENIFSHPYISYMANQSLERNTFILRTTFWKYLVPMPKFDWKVHQKNWTL